MKNKDKRQGGIRAAISKLAARIKAIFTKKEVTAVTRETAEECFTRELTSAFRTNADVFNGLYSSLQRIVSGQAKKKKERVLHEWQMRTRYKWEGQPIEEITNTCLEPITAESPDEDIKKWAALILKAAADAGITKETADRLTLDENNSGAYSDLDGGELYIDDEIEVVMPAWYQCGKILEKGYCKRVSEE